MDDKEKEQIRQERARITQARVEDSKVIDPPIKVLFQNIEDPPTPSRPSPPLSFTYGRYTFKESRENDIPDTALRHGFIYELPMSVVKHLNSLKVPVYGQITDPVTKAIKTIVTGYQHRFSCVPQEVADFIKEPTPAKAADPLA